MDLDLSWILEPMGPGRTTALLMGLLISVAALYYGVVLFRYWLAERELRRRWPGYQRKTWKL